VRGAWGRVSEIEKKRQIEIALVEKPSSMGIGHTSAVRQVLINLISNAVKFSRDGGKIWVGLAEEMHWIHFSVKDEGRGIPPNEIPRIFDRFYRATGSERIQGAGLGLYIAKLLVEAMAGKLSVQSTLEEGSTLTVSLQRQSTDREISRPPFVSRQISRQAGFSG